MTVLHLTDLHLFADPGRTLMGWATEDSFEAVLDAALAERRPDAVVLTGDLAQDGSQEAYARLARRLRPLGSPCLWLPGNHDHAARMAAAFAPFPWMRGGTLDLVPSDAVAEGSTGWRIVAVDTSTLDGDYGVLSATTLQRLDAALRAAPGRRTVVALHHPPVSVGAAWLDAIGLHDAGAFWRVLDRHPHVKAVLFGHIHQAVETKRMSRSGHVVRLLATPATCFQFAPGTHDFALDARPPAYRWLHFGSSLRTDLHRVAVATTCLPTAAGY
ncbi:MAG: metallophosphoesterase [Bacteroidota bacterium]